ncbi:MAG: SRPBCC domain-containing protein [Myxococcota bacterium]
MNKILTAALLTTLAMPAIAHAEVSDSLPSGLGVKHVVTIAAPTAKVYASLLKVGRWWNPEHSYSKQAANLSLTARPGGCFCEKLANGGGAVHSTVTRVEPGSLLIMVGGLGPLAGAGVTGAMTWALEAVDAKTTKLTMTYNVGGYLQGGLATMAAPVDKVLGEQVARLKTFVETGKPTS